MRFGSVICLGLFVLFVSMCEGQSQNGSDIDTPTTSQSYLWGTTQISVSGTITKADIFGKLVTTWPDGSTTNATAKFAIGKIPDLYVVVNYMTNGGPLPSGIYLSELKNNQQTVLWDKVHYNVRPNLGGATGSQ